MYRLLIIAPPSATLPDDEEWKSHKFDPVVICPDVDSAMSALRHQSFEAIGAADERAYLHLRATLRQNDISVPAFLLPADTAARAAALKEVRHLIHRLHVDFTDEQYSLKELSQFVQYEMVHNYLSGSSNDAAKLRLWFEMMRSDIPLNLPCRMYSLALPQGDLYLADHWHHGQSRLQKALERNFFGRIPQLCYCAVAFISPVEARLVLVPDQTVDLDAVTDTLDSEVIDCANSIRAYLELEINVCEAGSVSGLTEIA